MSLSPRAGAWATKNKRNQRAAVPQNLRETKVTRRPEPRAEEARRLELKRIGQVPPPQGPPVPSGNRGRARFARRSWTEGAS